MRHELHDTLTLLPWSLRTVYSVMTLEVWVSVFSFVLLALPSTWSSSSIPSCSSLSIKVFSKGSWGKQVFIEKVKLNRTVSNSIKAKNVNYVILRAHPYTVGFKHPFNVLNKRKSICSKWNTSIAAQTRDYCTLCSFTFISICFPGAPASPWGDIQWDYHNVIFLSIYMCFCVITMKHYRVSFISLHRWKKEKRQSSDNISVFFIIQFQYEPHYHLTFIPGEP